MADIEFKLAGLEPVVAKMRELPTDLRRRGARTAMRKAAMLVRDAAVMNADALDDPQTAEHIAANIAVRFSGRQLRATGDIMFRVGVLGGARQYANTRGNRRAGRVGAGYAVGGSKANPGGDTYYWRYIEFGTSPRAAQAARRWRRGSRMTKSRRGHPGVPARPFMRPALANNISAATDVAVVELNRAIDRIIRRASRRR